MYRVKNLRPLMLAALTEPLKAIYLSLFIRDINVYTYLVEPALALAVTANPLEFVCLV